MVDPRLPMPTRALAAPSAQARCVGGGLARRSAWALAFVLLLASPAAAHKTSVFVAVQGRAITGEAFFRGGTPVRGATVTVLGPAGEKLGEARTDEGGKFTFEPRVRCEHRLMIDAGEGHAAEAAVQADELPADLPTPANAPSGLAASAAGPLAKPSTAEPVLKMAPSGARDNDLRAELESIRSQLVEVRRDLAAHEDATRLRDILGGIGYILGLMGLAFYFLGVRRKSPRSPDSLRP